MLTSNSRLFGQATSLGRMIISRRVAGVLAIAGTAVFAASTHASAKALTFDSSPVADAVARIDRTLDAQITIKPGVDEDALVSFTVPDIGLPGARLEAINDLANALKADYTKELVISNATADGLISDPPIDSVEAPVVIAGGTGDAADVIRTIAGIDNASVKFYSAVHGTVSLSDKQMTAADAALEVAKQTRTIWKAVYIITPQASPRPGAVLSGTVIGYTTGGQPITELPGETFRAAVTPKDEDEKPDTSKTASTKTDATTPQDQAAQQPPSQYPYGYYPDAYGYGNYGYGNYGYGGYPGDGYGYGQGSTVIGAGGGISTTGPSYSPYGGYGYSPFSGGSGYGYSPYGGSMGNGYSVFGASPITLPTNGNGIGL
jgi:hypothetical protein